MYSVYLCICTFRAYLLSVQVVPAYSTGHTQVKEPKSPMHSPPFLHVLEPHSVPSQDGDMLTLSSASLKSCTCPSMTSSLTQKLSLGKDVPS